MAFNELLADRISTILREKKVSFSDKKMMGGLVFMVDEKMCVGIVKENLMVRLDPKIYEVVLEKTGCREMDFTKRPMKGYVFVEPLAIDMDTDLDYWIQLALDFNPKAVKSSKTTKKS